MDRSKFIETIMALYPDTFNPNNRQHFQLWIDRYKNALPAHWNFDKLMYYFDTQYKSTVIPPHPSFFYAYKECVMPRKKYVPPKDLTDEERSKSIESFNNLKEQVKNLARTKKYKEEKCKIDLSLEV